MRQPAGEKQVVFQRAVMLLEVTAYTFPARTGRECAFEVGDDYVHVCPLCLFEL